MNQKPSVVIAAYKSEGALVARAPARAAALVFSLRQFDEKARYYQLRNLEFFLFETPEQKDLGTEEQAREYLKTGLKNEIAAGLAASENNTLHEEELRRVVSMVERSELLSLLSEMEKAGQVVRYGNGYWALVR